MSMGENYERFGDPSLRLEACTSCFVLIWLGIEWQFVGLNTNHDRNDRSIETFQQRRHFNMGTII